MENGINTLAYGDKDIKIANLDSITNKNKKNTVKNGHLYLIIRIGLW